MKTKILIWILFLFISTTIPAQQLKEIKYAEIPVVENIDSLEQTIVQIKNNPQELLNTYLILEKSRSNYSSFNFGKDNDKIDSLAKKYKLHYTGLLTKYFLLKKISIEGSLDKNIDITTFDYLIDEFVKLKDTTCLARCYSALMSLYIADAAIYAENKEMATKYFLLLKNLIGNSKSIEDKLFFYSRTISYDVFKKDHSNMINYLNAALQLIDKNPEYNYYKTYFLYNYFIEIYYKNNYATAVVYLDKCLKIPNINQSMLAPYCYYNAGVLYRKLNNMSEAEMYLNKALLYIKLNNASFSRLYSSIYFELAEIKFANKEYDSAWLLQKKSDSCFVIATQKGNSYSIAQLQNNYQITKKGLENKIVSEQNLIYKLIILTAAIIIIMISILIYQLRKNLRRVKELGYFRDKVHSIISHDLRSPFEALQGLNKLASYYLKNNKIEEFNTLALSIDETSVNISNLLNNLLHWAKANNSEIKNAATKKFNCVETINSVLKLYETVIETNKITIYQNINNDVVITNNKNVVELIIRNWVDNILKHSEATEISFSSICKENITEIIVANNGSIDAKNADLINQQLNDATTIKQQNAIGLGLSLIAYFSKQNNIKVYLEVLMNGNKLHIQILNK